ncbi:MAG: chemotaxis protein CheA [Pseudomonadota bacterium]
MDKDSQLKLIELIKTEMPELHRALKNLVRSGSYEELPADLVENLLAFHEPYSNFVAWVVAKNGTEDSFSFKIKNGQSNLDLELNKAFPSHQAEIESSHNDDMSLNDTDFDIMEGESDSINEELLGSADEHVEDSGIESMENQTPAEIDDEEAMRLLESMDAPLVEHQSAEIDDDEAAMLLAEMDAPASSGSEIDDDEAMRLLNEMDSPSQPAAKSGNLKNEPQKSKKDFSQTNADEEALELLSAFGGDEGNLDESPKEPPPKVSARNVSAKEIHKDADDSEEQEEEIEEFSGSEFASDPEMMNDFLSNADDLMENLDTQILALEQNPTSKNVIEEIFRAAHTLKGAAGMFGFKALERVMHRLENYFDLVRKGKAVANPDTIDVVFQAMDVMRKLLDGVRNNRPSGVLTSQLITKLNKVCAGTYTRDSNLPQVETVEKSAAKKENHSEHKADSSAEGHEPAAKQQENSTIKVDIERLDALVNLVGELVIDRGRFVNIEEDIRVKTKEHDITAKMSETVQLFGRHMNEIQDIIMKVRMVPIGNTFNKFTRIVRDISRQLGKEIELTIIGEDTELDKTLVEQLGDPLVHLIRNACDHGCETQAERQKNGKHGKASIELSARQEGNQIIISITDDGKGMDSARIKAKAIEKGIIKEDAILSPKECLNLIFEAGFSTVENVTNLSGRGVGMDVVKRQISKLKGNIDIQSAVGKGSTITINLPLTLAIVQSLLVKSESDVFAIPLSTVVESIRIHPSEIQHIGNSEVIKRRDSILPLVYLNKVLDLNDKDKKIWYKFNQAEDNLERSKRHKRLFVVVIGTGDKKFGIVVDHLLNQQEMVIKPMGALLKQIPCVAGGAILGNGEAVLVLDMAEVEFFVRQQGRQNVAA